MNWGYPPAPMTRCGGWRGRSRTWRASRRSRSITWRRRFSIGCWIGGFSVVQLRHLLAVMLVIGVALVAVFTGLVHPARPFLSDSYGQHEYPPWPVWSRPWLRIDSYGQYAWVGRRDNVIVLALSGLSI